MFAAREERRKSPIHLGVPALFEAADHTTFPVSRCRDSATPHRRTLSNCETNAEPATASPAPRNSERTAPDVQLLTPLAKDTELVTLGVGQYNPRLITLANINTLCAMSHQTIHLGVLIIRPEVEMQSALNLLALIKPDEFQPRQAIRLRADLELLIRGVDHDPPKSLGPPLPQGDRVYRVNNYLLPFQGHQPSLDLQASKTHSHEEGRLPAVSVSACPAVM